MKIMNDKYLQELKAETKKYFEDMKSSNEEIKH